MKETIQLKDFLDFSYLSNLQDNGKDIAYVVSRCNEKDNSYDQKLHMWKNDQDVTLTQSGKESLYLWAYPVICEYARSTRSKSSRKW